jgi:hypothetical protein
MREIAAVANERAAMALIQRKFPQAVPGDEFDQLGDKLVWPNRAARASYDNFETQNDDSAYPCAIIMRKRSAYEEALIEWQCDKAVQSDGILEPEEESFVKEPVACDICCGALGESPLRCETCGSQFCSTQCNQTHICED